MSIRNDLSVNYLYLRPARTDLRSTVACRQRGRWHAPCANERTGSRQAADHAEPGACRQLFAAAAHARAGTRQARAHEPKRRAAHNCCAWVEFVHMSVRKWRRCARLLIHTDAPSNCPLQATVARCARATRRAWQLPRRGGRCASVSCADWMQFACTQSARASVCTEICNARAMCVRAGRPGRGSEYLRTRWQQWKQSPGCAGISGPARESVGTSAQLCSERGIMSQPVGPVWSAVRRLVRQTGRPADCLYCGCGCRWR